MRECKSSFRSVSCVSRVFVIKVKGMLDFVAEQMSVSLAMRDSTMNSRAVVVTEHGSMNLDLVGSGAGSESRRFGSVICC